MKNKIFKEISNAKKAKRNSFKKYNNFKKSQDATTFKNRKTHQILEKLQDAKIFKKPQNAAIFQSRKTQQFKKNYKPQKF